MSLVVLESDAARAASLELIGYSALHWACLIGDSSGLQRLLGDSEGRHTSLVRGVDGKTALDVAHEYGHVECLRLLVERYPDQCSIRMIMCGAPIKRSFRLCLGGGEHDLVQAGSKRSSLRVSVQNQIRKRRKSRVVQHWQERFVVLSATLRRLCVWADAGLPAHGNLNHLLACILVDDILCVRLAKSPLAQVLIFQNEVAAEPVFRLRCNDSRPCYALRIAICALGGRAMAACLIQAVWRGWRTRLLSRKLLSRLRLASSSILKPGLARAVSAPAQASSPKKNSNASLGPKSLLMKSAVVWTSKRLLRASSTTASARIGRRTAAFVGEMGQSDYDGVSGLVRVRKHKGRLFYWSRPRYARATREWGCIVLSGPNARPVDPASCKQRIDLVDILSVRFAGDGQFMIQHNAQQDVHFNTATNLRCADQQECARWVAFLQSCLPLQLVAALTLQCRIRVYLAQKRVARLRDALRSELARHHHHQQQQFCFQEEEQARMLQAALTVQAWWRRRRRRQVATRTSIETEELEGYRHSRGLSFESTFSNDSIISTVSSCGSKTVWETAIDERTQTSFFYVQDARGRSRKSTWTLPRGWIKAYDEKTCRHFYYHTVTQESMWSLPF